MTRRDQWISFWALLAILAVVGGLAWSDWRAGMQPEREEAQVEDCALRASATAGNFSGSLQLCLQDRYGWDGQRALLSALARTMYLEAVARHHR